MDDQFIERLRTLADRKKLSYSKLGKLIGVSKDTAGNYLTGRTDISIDLVKKLAASLDVDVNWLLTGKGDIFDGNVPAPGTKNTRHLIPFFDIDATGSGIEVFSQDFKPSFFMDLPGFRDCNFSINVFGNSMSPTFDSGTIILCRELTDKGHVIYGEVYLIVTDENRLLRRVLKSSHKGQIMTHCDNPEGEGTHKGRRYADQELTINSIIKIYLVKGSIRRHQI